MATEELSDDFLNAGWAEWDLDDAYMVIDEALDYMDAEGSL